MANLVINKSLMNSQRVIKSSAAITPTKIPSLFDAARFLAQASMNANRAQIVSCKSLGLQLDFKFNQDGFDASAWHKLLSAPDTLRQRIVLALSEIVVVSIDGLDAY